MCEQLEQPLDGLKLDYTYEGGGRIIASFSRGQLQYRWLSGPFEGVEETGLKYSIRQRCSTTVRRTKWSRSQKRRSMRQVARDDSD
jgi:hypothetical protein